MGAELACAPMAEKNVDRDHLIWTGTVRNAARELMRVHDRAYCSSRVQLKRFRSG
jgi:hypothetical protein